MIDWKRLLAADDGYHLQPGAGAGDLAAAETALKAAFPADLNDVYRVSNGVFDATGQWFVIWPLAEVITRNQRAWAEECSPSRRALVGSVMTEPGIRSAFPEMAPPVFSPGRQSSERRHCSLTAWPSSGRGGSEAHSQPTS